MADPVYFIADAHLGSSTDDADSVREVRLLAFLRQVRERRAAHVYILGDLFDFWFEYRHVMPWRHANVLAAIRATVEGGVPVTFLGGNHDWWAGPVFAEYAGMTVHRKGFAVEHQGRRVFLHHGDGLASKGDSGYVIMKAALRNRWVIRLLRLVHPDLAYAFGHRFSRFSRQRLTGGHFELAPAVGAYVDARLAEGHDAVAIGHLHTRFAEERPGGGRFFVLGDWMSIFSTLRLEDGEFVWEDWSSGQAVDVPISAPAIYGGHGDETTATRPDAAGLG